MNNELITLDPVFLIAIRGCMSKLSSCSEITLAVKAE